MIVTDYGRENLKFLQLHLGGDRNFHYLIGDPHSGQAAAVDPGFAAAEFHSLAQSQGLEITRILITHGHSDHYGCAGDLADLTGARIHAGQGSPLKEFEPLIDNLDLAVGGLSVRAIATPGHAPDHYCFLCEDCLITGDLLFCGKVGGTGSYFPGSSARQEWDSLQHLLELPRETRVYPGHDYYGGEGTMPFSSLGFEQDNNPFLTSGSFADFCDLKENWAAYKQEHGIR